MKLSRNWLQLYIEEELPDTGALVEKIGAQLGAVEEVIDLAPKYKDVVIVLVKECQKHPDADKLNVCKIDDGGVTEGVQRDEDGLVQVVCGAPNVKSGLMVAWLPPQAVVPATYGTKDEFKLSVREIRGVNSNGMLASPKELAIGENHDGILELKTGESKQDFILSDPVIKPGDSFMKVYGLDDVIIDVENKMFTHRPDCFGILGVAREVAGILGYKFQSPEIYLNNPALDISDGTKLEITNEIPHLVPRFMAQVIEGIEIKPSPILMQTMLTRVGIRPINKIVDITNYFMYLTGQPMHAYDYDKVYGLSSGYNAKIVIRNPKPKEQISLLNGKTITPRQEAIMIATDKQLIGIGGVMGGSETVVDESTKRIILECATFDMYSIRRTSMANGLFTDAVTRFSKGQSPLQNARILNWCSIQIISEGQAQVVETIDNNHVPETTLKRDSMFPDINISSDYINKRLGIGFNDSTIAGLLDNVEFKVDIKNEVSLTTPFWRTDIELREDVVEEVGRLYGYDKLKLELPRRDITPPNKNQLLETKYEIRNVLSSAGANEVLTYSFIHSDLFKKSSQDAACAFGLSNAISPDLEYYRLTLTPSLLDKVYPNLRAGYNEFVLYELGKAHKVNNLDEEGMPVEEDHTALVVAKADKLKESGSAYYLARKYLSTLAPDKELSFSPLSEVNNSDQLFIPYEPKRSAVVSLKATGQVLGVIGEFKPSVIKAMKLPKFCAGFEVQTDYLTQLLASRDSYRPSSRFPKVWQDISLSLSADIKYEDIYNISIDLLNKIQPQDTIYDFDLRDIYQSEDSEAEKHITFRFSIASYEKTLTDKEVSVLLDKLAEHLMLHMEAKRI